MATPTTDLNLGPLTTTFRAPPACNSITVDFENASYLPVVYPRRFASIASSCFPDLYPLGNDAFTSTFILYGQQDQHVYYSPGICPSSWTKNIAGTSGPETTAFCCQPGFNAETSPAVNPPGGDSTLCTSSISSTVLTTVAYTGDGDVDESTGTFTFSGANVPAGAIWIRYRDGDPGVDAKTTGTATSSLEPLIPTSKPAPKSAGGSDSGLTTITISGVTVTQQPSLLTTGARPTATPISSSSSGLSTGAKIGLGVGIPLAVILVLSVFAFMFLRKRRQRRLASVAMVGAGSSGSEVKPAELSGKDARPRSELPSGDLGAMGDRTAGRSELSAGDGDAVISELEGGERSDGHGGGTR